MEEIDDRPDRRCSQQPYEGPERRTGTNRRATTIDEKIKVSTERLDNLINMAGELVIAQLMVAEEISTKLASDHSIKGKINHQGKIVRELQELSMSMRMVPIQGVFQKMARLVRDLSRKADKAVNFVTVGEETELDRSIVDKIADPLVHMIRNSVDHGMETAEERAKTDKDPIGKIELKAYHQAGHIIIEVKDDGRGLNKESILKKAITNGLVDEKQELSDDEICKLIFHAGLSTAKTITTVSGRGVGMDVVKKNIESLKGKVEITSETGKGTTFIIRMPLTLAIIDGQIVTIGPERYIIPINSIIESFRPTAEQLSSVQNKGEMVIVRGQLIPLVRLYKLFNTTPNTQDPTQALLVIVEEDNKKCCFLVDELLGQQQIVIKNLGEGMGTVPGISGGAIMGDGKISLICDVPGLMDLAWN
ncbi:MAG: chemotaxis protein CheA [Planctomycetes bacterium]|nr:chemotaxis protein CheA [Planctomycetota bacterium]